MNPKTRAAMVRNITEIIAISEAMSRLPFQTEKSLNAIADDTLDALGKVVDAIYTWGYTDASDHALGVVRNSVKDAIDDLSA